MRLQGRPKGETRRAQPEDRPARSIVKTASATPPRSTRGGVWTWTKRLVPWVLLAVAVTLLVRQGRGVDWPAVVDALRAQPSWRLVVAAGMAVLSYTIYASFDLVARHETRHGLPAWRALAAAAISYAVNLNLGSLLGGVAVRLRLYTRWGLDLPTAGRVVALAMLTNWSGYLLVAGAALMLRPPELPADWPIAQGTLRAVGALMVALALGYAALCRWSPRRTLHWRGHELKLPRGRTAVVQLALSAANWMLMGALVWWLLQQRIDYVLVLSVLLLAAVAGVIAHVPAGLGVLEAVFLAALGDRVPTPALLAALLAYRACYFLLPLTLALPALLLSELAARRAAKADRTPAQAPGPQSMQRSTGGGPMRSAR
ncbi:MAG: lysylphosphatidylglycerol synthase domain-containing protein [Rubrivivax sp.]